MNLFRYGNIKDNNEIQYNIFTDSNKIEKELIDSAGKSKKVLGVDLFYSKELENICRDVSRKFPQDVFVLTHTSRIRNNEFIFGKRFYGGDWKVIFEINNPERKTSD